MRKKRLIYTLLFNEGYFMLSRNFRLQKVGDLKWIENHYNFKKIAFSIDELIILNVARNDKKIDEFCKVVTQVINNVFVPVSVGGGITNMEIARSFFMSGADKIVVNSVLAQNPDLIKDIAHEYGSQSIIASIDFTIESGKFYVFTNNGNNKLDYDFLDYIQYVQNLGIGEVYLNSIQKDGTGQGYLLKELSPYLDRFTIPVILAGGAGNSKHFLEAAKMPSIDAVATANLFNFLGDALPNSRKEMLNAGVHLSLFDPIED